MDVASTPPQGRLVLASRTNRAHLSRLAKRGEALRLASGMYAVGAILPPEAVARLHRDEVIGLVWPGAVVRGRSALAGGNAVDGVIFVAHPDPPRRSPLRLPGVTVVAEVAPGALPGDMPLPHGLSLAGVARTLVENIDTPGRPRRSQAGTVATEDRIDTIARRGGAGRIQQVLAELDVIAGSFDPRAVAAVRARLAAVLGTVSGRVESERLAARLAGTPFDAHVLDRLEVMLDVLRTRAPIPRNADSGADRWTWLPFFEAYFSNFIEGTEFGVEEARRIAVEGHVPEARPADAHDVAATYRLVSDPEDNRTVPNESSELLELLRARHRVLMAARPDKRPGEFKDVANFAGGHRFVEPELVNGTLQRGFESMARLVDPLGRATMMMALITECHPFDDGNGRIARLMANAELSSAGQARLIIPTSFRNNYLAALSGWSTGNGDGQSLHSVLDFAQRWVCSIDWQSYEGADDVVRGSNAYLDPGVAETSGQRLRLGAEP